MKAAIAFSIALHWVNQLIAVFIKGTAGCFKVIARLCEIIVIDKIIAGIVRRVNVNHFDLSEIILPEDFQYVKVVTLDIEILGVPKIFGSIKVGT